MREGGAATPTLRLEGDAKEKSIIDPFLRKVLASPRRCYDGPKAFLGRVLSKSDDAMTNHALSRSPTPRVVGPADLNLDKIHGTHQIPLRFSVWAYSHQARWPSADGDLAA
jgi:hypothetical protein